MAMKFRYDAGKNIFFITAAGVLTNEDAGLVADGMLGHRNFSPEARTFHDYTRVTDYLMSSGFLIKLGQRVKAHGVSANRAFLLGSPIGMGTAIFYSKGLASPKARLFYDRKKALDWLNEGMPPAMRIT